MQRGIWKWLAVMVVVAGIAAGWLWGRPRRPNVLLITLDTTRADRLGCYGYWDALTPYLDSLAETGVLFENATANVPLTLPSHSTLHTGLLPPEHGLRVNGMGSLPVDIPTLSEQFSRQGYATGGFVAAFVLDKRFGLQRGFQKYDDDLSGDTTGEGVSENSLGRRRRAARVIDSALEWLQSQAGRSYFCWMHFYDPHDPCSEHEELFRNRFKGRGYDAEISYVDQQLQRLTSTLKERGQLENTLIVVVGDHGEGLGDHDEDGHGQQLYNSTLRVPLILNWPERCRGKVKIREQVAISDLYPTILQSMGWALPAGSHARGRDLQPALAGVSPPSVPLYIETWDPYFHLHCAPQQGLIRAGFKYVRSPRPELYELAADPQEQHNLARSKPEQVSELEAILKELETQLSPHVPTAVQQDEKLMAALRSFGYAGGASSSVPPLADTATLPDIKDRMRPFHEIQEGLNEYSAGRLNDALAIFTRIHRDYPDFYYSQVYHAAVLAKIAVGTDLAKPQRDQMLREAAGMCRAVIQAEGKLPGVQPNWQAHSTLAAILEQLGDFAQAEQAFDQAAKLHSTDPKLFANWGDLLLARKQPEAALEKLRLAVELDEGSFVAQTRIGEILLQLARAREKSAVPAEREQAVKFKDDARQHFELAIRYNPQYLLPQVRLAVLLLDQRDLAGAVARLQQVVTLEPRDPEVRYLLALALSEQGDCQAALPHLAAALRLRPQYPAAQQLLKKCQGAGE